MIQHSPAQILLELLESKLQEGLSVTEIFIFLHENGYKSFTGKPFTYPTLLTTLKTIKEPSFRPSSVVANLINARG